MSLICFLVWKEDEGGLTGVAGLGLVAYPFHGIMKSIESTVKSKTRRAIINARLREGYDLTRRIDLSPEEVRHLLQRFESLMQGAEVYKVGRTNNLTKRINQ